MEESTIWWLLAGGLVVAELLTGTFYLLMLAVGVGAAAIAAHLGASATVMPASNHQMVDSSITTSARVCI